MKQVLLVSGHLAALKSTLSKKLSIDLNAICLNKDDMKEVLGDTIGFTNREENLKLSKATFQMMLKMMLDILKIDDLVILESNFKVSEMNQLNALIEEQKIHSSTVFLTGDAKVLYERYVKRQPERHPVHTSTGLISFDNFKASMESFDQSVYGGSYILFDTTVMNEELYQVMLQQVKNLLKG
jgi:predicted kinase